MTTDDTTQLLLAARDGDREAFDLLFSRVYEELRGIARGRLVGHRPGETLNTTGLVHEAYMKLVDPSVGARDRAHFLALASRAMRFIVIDHARARQAQKRAGGRLAVPFDEQRALDFDAAAPARADPVDATLAPAPGRSTKGEPGLDLLLLDRALDALSSRSERQGKLVEYRFFAGLTYEEISEIMGLSVRTVKRDWVRARTWLYMYMQGALSGGEPV